MSESPNPVWIEVRCPLPPDRAEEVAARLAALGWLEWWVDQPLHHQRDAGGWATAPDTEAAATLHVCVADRSEAARLLRALDDLAESARVGELRAKDWLNDWRQDRGVVVLADGWSIAPPWLRDQAPDAQRVIVIDPGLGFGAGDHPTTRDSAVFLVENLRRRQSVLDLGAGSGVLSILAARAGAGRVVAVEIDEFAAAEIRRNGSLNGSPAIEVVVGDAAVLAGLGRFDLIVANLGAREANALRPVCQDLAAAGATLILSGLTEWSAPEVAAGYAADGWLTRRRRQSGSEWVTLLLTRRSALEADRRSRSGGR